MWFALPFRPTTSLWWSSLSLSSTLASIVVEWGIVELWLPFFKASKTLFFMRVKYQITYLPWYVSIGAMKRLMSVFICTFYLDLWYVANSLQIGLYPFQNCLVESLDSLCTLHFHGTLWSLRCHINRCSFFPWRKSTFFYMVHHEFWSLFEDVPTLNVVKRILLGVGVLIEWESLVDLIIFTCSQLIQGLNMSIHLYKLTDAMLRIATLWMKALPRPMLLFSCNFIFEMIMELFPILKRLHSTQF